jgi:hypothetical protein
MNHLIGEGMKMKHTQQEMGVWVSAAGCLLFALVLLGCGGDGDEDESNESRSPQGTSEQLNKNDTGQFGIQGGTVYDFDNDSVGQIPKGWSHDRTGQGQIGNWIVMGDTTAPSKSNVLAQISPDQADYRFPVTVLDSSSYIDMQLSVKFKAVKGSVDQGAGLVWRYRDINNYYVVRANALEDNVVLYKVEKGKRTDLPLVGKGRTYGMKERVPTGKWGSLRIIATGSHFDVFHNGKKLFEVQDSIFTEAGKVGLWTKADSYTLFDNLTILSKDK